MICKNLKTGKYFNYRFVRGEGLIELDDTQNPKLFIQLFDWYKNYLVIDKWRNLNEWDIKYNKEIENGKLSSS